MAAAMGKVVLRLSSVQFCRNSRLFKLINLRKMVKVTPHLSAGRTYANMCLKRHFSAVEEARVCWKCDNEIAAERLLCQKCGKIQNVDRNANYFKVFDINQCFAICASDLSNKFKALQGLLHPDKFAGKSEREQDYSSECSSFLNAAYNTLLQPLERGEYLLKLNHEEIGETGMEMDQEFLMDIMEINELLAGTHLSGQKLKQVDEENKVRVKETLEKLTGVFEDNLLDEAKVLLAKLKYFVNIEKKIKALEIEFGIIH